MNTPQRDFQRPGDLLGLHLGLLDGQAQTDAEAQWADPATRQQLFARLDRLLSPLNADRLAPPPAHLERNILARVAAGSRHLPFPRLTAAAASSDAAQRSGGAFMAFREVVGLAAAIALFVSILVPGLASSRIAAQKVACMNNFRDIGNGYVNYVEDNDGVLPFAGPAPEGASWLARSPQERLSNSRHAFRLVAGRYVPAGAFVDPGRPNDHAIQQSQIAGRVDFPDPRNVSYSTNFVQRPWKGLMFQADMPLAADMNPLVDDPSARTCDGSTTNSRSHSPSNGQNVLRQDISVRWTATPRVGVQGDDIYRIVGVQKYTGLERPRTETDAFLIP